MGIRIVYLWYIKRVKANIVSHNARHKKEQKQNGKLIFGKH